MYERSKKGNFAIWSIWIADVASQGMSYVLNEDNLGNDRKIGLASHYHSRILTLLSQKASWMDHARDLLYMINHFRDQMSRPLIGIGHSMGGAQMSVLKIPDANQLLQAHAC